MPLTSCKARGGPDDVVPRWVERPKCIKGWLAERLRLGTLIQAAHWDSLGFCKKQRVCVSEGEGACVRVCRVDAKTGAPYMCVCLDMTAAYIAYPTPRRCLVQPKWWAR